MSSTAKSNTPMSGAKKPILTVAKKAKSKKTAEVVKTKELTEEEQNVINESNKLGIQVYNGSNPYIFVSYSHRDSDAVKKILKRLEKERFRIWYDDSMEVGEDFRDELRVKIEGCGAFLLFVSKHSMESKYCGMEILTAYKYDKKIYPVFCVENVEIPPAFKMMLENTQHSLISNEQYLDKLVDSLPLATRRTLESVNKVLTKCKDGSEEITIHSGLTAIGEEAFKGNKHMKKITLGKDIAEIRREAFRGCAELKEIELKFSVTKVGDSAFRDCVKMEKLTVENKDIEIGERAFENCASLKDIELPGEMTEIYGGVFNSCKALKRITLPAKLNVMGESCFADCSALEDIDIPAKVSKIGDMAFNGCITLKIITLPNGLAKIGKHAFKDCQNLKTISIPASVISIGSGAFRGCNNLEIIDVDHQSRSFKSVDGILFNKNKSMLLCYPAKKNNPNFTIPDSVTTIGDWALCGNKSLTDVIIPDSVQEIGEGAFHLCTALETIIIPDSVTVIDDSAFRGCSSLKRVFMPDSVREFGWGVFSGCHSELNVVCSNNSTAAKYCDNLKISHSES